MNILIVEDDPQIRRMLVQFIEERGHRALEANDLDGAEGLVSSADAVISDGNFPTWITVGLTQPKPDNWLAVLLRARRLGIPFVLMSGALELEPVAKLVRVPFFPKPCDIDQIVELLETAVIRNRVVPMARGL